jgi:hypothetical protein
VTGTASSLVLFSVLCFLSLFLSPNSRTETNFTIDAASSLIEASIETESPRLSDTQLKRWVQNAADAIVAYYGRYPVPHAFLQIRSFNGKGVRAGRTFAMHGGSIRIALGNETTEDDLASDWMLTHEMVHLTFPSVPDEHHWIEEGIATYVEPIARIQAGQFNTSRMWFELVRDMPKGLAQPGDQGLDHTHTWGRTYWGGALFCFVADVEIRKQTQNKKGLQDALRGILNAGGDMREDWELEKALQTGDRATGTDVLMKLYQRMRNSPENVDLAALWKQLGIHEENGAVQFQDDAPLAAIRRSITAPRADKGADK